MKAMVLAAGLGTRLRPLTEERPKALVTVGGRTLLELTLLRLRSAGVTEVIVNVHHFAEAVADFLKKNRGSGMRIELSREDALLDTGGGLKQAAWFFAGETEPFLLHNVDILTNIDLRRMAEAHGKSGALATLAVQQRESARVLLFDEQGGLCGRSKARDEQPEMARPCAQPQAMAFCGIHVISPRLLGMWQEDGVFSIIDAYLRLARAGEKIAAFPADEYAWRDVGRKEDLAQAEQELKEKPELLP
ncbi:MAG TPA: sugar phosphate nucleotidyltransferase [Terriglobales bacterium]|nr:sugar phosphate nucleotidyltransferase [Terriglobales bacterium]